MGRLGRRPVGRHPRCDGDSIGPGARRPRPSGRAHGVLCAMDLGQACDPTERRTGRVAVLSDAHSGPFDEACWRLLAQLCQTPFYQRLRVDLQLGYAVFSGLKQINGQTGLLFGVQSPSVSAAQLAAHVEQFLGELPDLIHQLDDSTLHTQQQALAAQFQGDALPFAQAADLLWQGKLAGRPSNYLRQLVEALCLLDRKQLLDAARRLAAADGGRLCLSNGTCPDTRWKTAQ